MKAVLVLDEMPRGCSECHLAFDHCHGTVPPEKYYDKRPSWCPLKEMPKERILPRMQVDNTNYGEEPWFSDGWNACLEELEK